MGPRTSRSRSARGSTEDTRIATAILHELRLFDALGPKETTSKKMPEPILQTPERPQRRQIPQQPECQKPADVSLEAVAAECRTLGCIIFRIAPVGSSAGRILRHAISVMDDLCQWKAPLLFKIGFTHDPVWRWTNNIYGYYHEGEGWTNMIILHVSREPYSAAMLEASLIEKYQSNLPAVLLKGRP